MMSAANRAASGLGASRVYAKVLPPRAAPHIDSFPCGVLCMDCRYLADPAWRGDPMRVDDRVQSQPHCPRCGGAEWLDLRNRDTAAMVGEIDAYENEDRATTLSQGLIGAIILAGVTAIGVWLGLAVVPDHGWMGVVFTTIALTLAVAPIIAAPSSSALLSFSTRSQRRKTPARWHMVAPVRPRCRGERDEGLWLPTQLLGAPLTGRPCAAYELGVRVDSDAGAAASTWALLEQRSSDGRIGGSEVEPNACYLDLERRELDPSRIVLDRPTLDRFMRSRGLNLRDGYTFYETIIPAGLPCRYFSGDGANPPVVQAS